MTDIFVVTENKDPKVFDATKAGSLAAKAEAKMQKAVIEIITNAPGFTTDKKVSGKGYTLKLTLAKLEADGGRTKGSLKGEMVRYPPETIKKGDEGEVMVSTSMIGNSSTEGTSDGAKMDVIMGLTVDMATKSLPYMSADMVKR